MGDTAKEVEDALNLAQTWLPTLLAGVATFYPPAGALAKFLPLIGVAINGVQEVRKATGKSLEAAQAEVLAHVTPGLPNSAALS